MTALVPRLASAAARSHRRRRWVTALCGLVVLSSLLVGAKLAIAHAADARGTELMERGDYAGAERAFRTNLTANWIQPWRAHFNVGVALYHQRRWSSAQEQFAAALERAPRSKRCIVALNLAWSHEAEGDQLNMLQDFVGATESWRNAAAVAQDAGCDYESRGEEEDAEDQGGEGADEGAESGQQPEEAGPDPDGDGGGNDGTLEEQQQRTEQRNDQKSQDAIPRAAEQAAATRSAEDSPTSPEERLEQLTAANQRSQAERQQSTGTSGDRPADETDAELGRTW